MRRIFVAGSFGLLMSSVCDAHGFAGSGWVHPLTGVDHMLAMIAVGAWSAQLGGRSLIYVPVAFLVAMLVGGIVGFERLDLAGTEFGIGLSVLTLGIAIATESSATLGVAAIGVGLFGICHGYSHGYEIPAAQNWLRYSIGFLITTACLHAAGAVGAMLLLEQARQVRWLRLAGSAAAAIGAYLSLNSLLRLS